VIATPTTALRWRAGDAVYLPDNAEPGIGVRVVDSPEPIVLYDIRIFPYSAGSSSHDNFTEEPLDLDIGIRTARQLAPSNFAVGRLRLDPGAAITPDTQRRPVLAYVSSGEAHVATNAGDVTTKPHDATLDAPVGLIESGGEAALIAGEAAFVPVPAEFTLANRSSEPLEILVVTFDPILPSGG
jgi:hypothetical protein